MKHISPTFMYIIPMYLRLKTFTKNPPPSAFLYFIYIYFFFRSGAPPMTLLTAGALTDPQLPATASTVCTTDARPGGVGRVHPPQTKILATPVCVCGVGVRACVRSCMCACVCACVTIYVHRPTHTFLCMGDVYLSHSNQYCKKLMMLPLNRPTNRG